jgi:hypothetical protein
MKQNPSDSILRWCDRQPGGGTTEDRAARLIRDSLLPGVLGSGLDDPQLARIEQNLRRRRWSLRQPSLALRFALAAMLLVMGVASVMAFQAARRAGWFGPRTPEDPPSARPPAEYEAKKAGTSAPVEAGDATAVVEPVVDLPQGAPEEIPAVETSRPRRQMHAAQRASATAITEPEPAATSEEVLALDRAIGLLRGKHDAGAALLALDAYLGRFSAGMLNREARLARVDALLMLQRSEEALIALETMPLDAHRRSTELQLIRAELRARTDCARAEEDFSAVLARGQNASLEERALYGRGACRVKRGDGQGAAQDLHRYLDRFPNGAHADWARRWIASADDSSAKGR